jgi:pre-mRNA-splicing helicase BRR2
MGDVSTSDIKSAGDEVLAILKTENLNDNDRKREIEGILDRLSDETFNSLTVLAQQLVDYSPEEEYRGE